ncbi:MAG: acyl-CoA/acyl-ACP dehydrogenase [Curvibacter sp.]|nr:acyl-CoA/acyl-ACP dehydrogenase [Curvibacter sp.]
MSDLSQPLHHTGEPARTPPDEALALLGRARELGRTLATQAAERDLSAQAPADAFEALQAQDLLRLTIAREHGGHGAGLDLTRQVIAAIAYGDPSVALILSMHYSLHAAIARSLQLADGEWPVSLAHRLIQASLHSPSLMNAAQVEPALGSPSHGGLPATLARRVPGGWQISGHKVYVTGVPLLSWISVLAVTDEAEPRLGSFLLPREAPGVQVVETWDPIGMRATASHDVLFDAVAVPEDHAVGLRPAHLGQKRDPQTIAWYFSQVASLYDATARAGRDWLLGFLQQRRPSVLGGAALASLPTVQEAVGRIELLLSTNDWLLQSHAQAYDLGQAPDALGSLVKQVVSDNAVQALTQALQLAGNHGLSRHHPLERHHRNVLCSQVHAPPNALLRSQLGRQALERTPDGPATPV